MRNEGNFLVKACKWESLPRYLEGDFVKRVARLQRGSFEESARASMDPIAALHGSSCRLGLVRVIGPKLTSLAASATFLPLLAYFLRLTAQVVKPEEVHRHVCVQHASIRDHHDCSFIRFYKVFQTKDKSNATIVVE